MSASPCASCLKTSAARRCVVHTPVEGVIHICWVQQGTCGERTAKERPCCCYYHRISFASRDEDGMLTGSVHPAPGFRLSSSRAIFMWRGYSTVILGALLCLLFFSFCARVRRGREGLREGGDRGCVVSWRRVGVGWHFVRTGCWLLDTRYCDRRHASTCLSLFGAPILFFPFFSSSWVPAHRPVSLLRKAGGGGGNVNLWTATPREP
jgi:hypothetical protein